MRNCVNILSSGRYILIRLCHPIHFMGCEKHENQKTAAWHKKHCWCKSRSQAKRTRYETDWSSDSAADQGRWIDGFRSFKAGRTDQKRVRLWACCYFGRSGRFDQLACRQGIRRQAAADRRSPFHYMWGVTMKPWYYDYIRTTDDSDFILSHFLKDFIFQHRLRYMVYFRTAQNTRSKMIKFFCEYKLYRLCRKYGIEIKTQTEIGPGFLLCHPYNITVSPFAKLGKNVNLMKGSTIGASEGEEARCPCYRKRCSGWNQFNCCRRNYDRRWCFDCTEHLC